MAFRNEWIASGPKEVDRERAMAINFCNIDVRSKYSTNNNRKSAIASLLLLELRPGPAYNALLRPGGLVGKLQVGLMLGRAQGLGCGVVQIGDANRG